jgi:alginate O-acetyltransferase complex protein AlgI
MLFNSIDFAIFLPIVFVLYWFITQHNLKLQNFLIVIASYVFYGWWDWRFLSLIIFSTLVDYVIGVLLLKEENLTKRKIYLGISIVVNLGFLGFFKYYNFFLDNFITAFSFFGQSISSSSLNIVLPVGISFYTFQTLSYSIDVYKKKLEPTKDFIAFSAFVCFFPQLVAGPIERATNLLPQFYKKRKFDNNQAIDGIHLFLWGLFKKVVIADSCAMYVNTIFENYESLNSLSLLLGAFYFAFQIYCDFSGYSDMAIGLSKFFGFNLMQNFNFPYFSRDIAEFWRRWHISLSTWFRDYVYIPLGGSKGSKWGQIKNVFIIFLVSGFWHGANWTFIIWGAINALFFIPLLITKKNRANIDIVAEKSKWPSGLDLFKMVYTFSIVTLAWIFFRAKSVAIAIDYIVNIFSFNFKGGVNYLSIERYAIENVLLIFGFVVLEWLSRRNTHPFFGKYKVFKLGMVLLALFLFGVYSTASDFIYFQF